MPAGPGSSPLPNFGLREIRSSYAFNVDFPKAPSKSFRNQLG